MASALLWLFVFLDVEGRRQPIALRHLCCLSIARLSLDLLPSPSRCLDRTALEIAVALGIFDECRDPFGSVIVGIFAVGKGLSKVPSR